MEIFIIHLLYILFHKYLIKRKKNIQKSISFHHTNNLFQFSTNHLSKIIWTIQRSIDQYFSKISASLSLDLDISYLVEHSQREDHLERIIRDQGPPQLERFPIRHHTWTQYRHSIQIEKDDEKRWYRRVHQRPVTDPRIGNRSEDLRVLI